MRSNYLGFHYLTLYSARKIMKREVLLFSGGLGRKRIRMTLKAGYTHITVSLGLSRLELSTQASIEQVDTCLSVSSGDEDIALSVHVCLLECTARLSNRHFLLASHVAPVGEMGITKIDQVPEFNLRPTMKVIAELDAAAKVKYGTPKVSFAAYRYKMLKPKESRATPQVNQVQPSLF